MRLGAGSCPKTRFTAAGRAGWSQASARQEQGGLAWLWEGAAPEIVQTRLPTCHPSQGPRARRNI